VRERIADAGGEVVKQTGDGFFASFENPKAAIDAAVGIQRALADEIVAPDVRIGAHSGGAFRTEAESTDYGGQGVHVASRIGSAAQAGEILISAETVDGIGSSFRLSEPRTETWGLEQPVEVVSVDSARRRRATRRVPAGEVAVASGSLEAARHARGGPPHPRDGRDVTSPSSPTSANCPQVSTADDPHVLPPAASNCPRRGDVMS
jgi:class 3 adenylate cyclase